MDGRGCLFEAIEKIGQLGKIAIRHPILSGKTVGGGVDVRLGDFEIPSEKVEGCDRGVRESNSHDTHAGRFSVRALSVGLNLAEACRRLCRGRVPP
jgi:hypothetical protein